MSTLEQRWKRLPKREGAPDIRALRESAQRLRETDRVDFLLRSGMALHDRTRLTMLALMNLAGELTTTELQVVMRLSQPNVTRHLKILKRAGIVVTKKRKVDFEEVKEARSGPRNPSSGPHSPSVQETSGKAGRKMREDGRRAYHSAHPSITRMLP